MGKEMGLTATVCVHALDEGRARAAASIKPNGSYNLQMAAVAITSLVIPLSEKFGVTPEEFFAMAIDEYKFQKNEGMIDDD